MRASLVQPTPENTGPISAKVRKNQVMKVKQPFNLLIQSIRAQSVLTGTQEGYEGADNQPGQSRIYWC